MKCKKYVIYFALISLIFFISNDISAVTLGELKSQLNSVEEKYIKNQNDKKQTEEEIAKANRRIVELNREREKIQDDMQSLDNEIIELNKEIEKMQEELKRIANYYQKTNSTSIYLEYVFTASSFTDFIYRLAVSEQLSQYRKDTIGKFNKLVEENKKKVKELAEKKVALEKIQEEVSAQLKKLGDNLSSITEEAVDLKGEVADLKKQINVYENTYKCSLNEQISTCVNRYNNNNSSGIGNMPSAAGFYRPILSGALNYEYGYTAKYGGYHDGIDFSVPHNTTVYSVADGVVVAVKPRQSCGGNMVYIGHTVKGKTYTSAYFHLASINVSEGQFVTHNTIIGYSGGVHAIEWWDSIKCSTGAHLHFQISTGIYMKDYFWYSDFKSRSFNPRNVINFPSTDVRFYGR